MLACTMFVQNTRQCIAVYAGLNLLLLFTTFVVCSLVNIAYMANNMDSDQALIRVHSVFSMIRSSLEYTRICSRPYLISRTKIISRVRDKLKTDFKHSTCRTPD